MFTENVTSSLDQPSISLKNIMKFLTGSFSIPILGLPSQLRVEFVHGCPQSCRCKPSVSTCDLTLKIAVHYSTVDCMVEVLKEALTLCRGFDDM